MCTVWPFAEKDPRDFYERKLKTGQTKFPLRGLKTRRRSEGGRVASERHIPHEFPETVSQRQRTLLQFQIYGHNWLSF